MSVIFREEYIAPIPEAERHDMMLAYHAQLNSVDDHTRLTAAKAWTKWESVLPFSVSKNLLMCRPKKIDWETFHRPCVGCRSRERPLCQVSIYFVCYITLSEQLPVLLLESRTITLSTM